MKWESLSVSRKPADFRDKQISLLCTFQYHVELKGQAVPQKAFSCFVLDQEIYSKQIHLTITIYDLHKQSKLLGMAIKVSTVSFLACAIQNRLFFQSSINNGAVALPLGACIPKPHLYTTL